MQLQMIFLLIKVQPTFERIWTTRSSYILWQWDTSSELSQTPDWQDGLAVTDSEQGRRTNGEKEDQGSVLHTPYLLSAA